MTKKSATKKKTARKSAKKVSKKAAKQSKPQINEHVAAHAAPHADKPVVPHPPSEKKAPTASHEEQIATAAGHGVTPSLFERMRRKLLPGRSNLKKDLEKVEQLTESQQRKKEISDKIFAQTYVQKKTKREKVPLKVFLRKAGWDIDPKALRQRAFMFSIISWFIITVVFLVMAVLNRRTWEDVAIFMLGFWTGGFAGWLVLIGIGLLAYIDIRIVNRRNQLELVLPDFLQLAAANIGAGMTIDRALWFAVRPRFGVFAKEMETVAKDVLTGQELDVALREFSTKYDSPVLERSINLLLEGVAAGGKIAELLHKISVDIQEQRILEQEMSANVMTYVIFISFAAVGAAPILFGLSTQLLVVIQDIAGSIGDAASSGVFNVSPDVVRLSDFKVFSWIVLIATSTISALIVAVIRSGKMFEGLRLIPIYVVISIVLYTLATSFFSSLFSGII